MTKEQIERISEWYADSKVPERNSFDDDDVHYGHLLRAKEVLAGLSDKYLIVEKERIEAIYKEKDKDYKEASENGDNEGCYYNGGILHILGELLYPDCL